MRSVNTSHKISANIPDLICLVILLFFMEREYFDKTGKDCKISDDKLSVWKSKEGYNYDNTTYCNQWIPSTSNMIYRWKFKINSIETQILIGITSNDDCQNEDFTLHNKESTYALASTGDWRIENGIVLEEDVEGMEFVVGNEVTFILNFIEKKILFQVNDEKEIILFKTVKANEDLKYKLAVCLLERTDKITLIDFATNFE